MRLTQRMRLDPEGWLEATRLFPFHQLRWLLLPLARRPGLQATLLDPLEGLKQHAPLGFGRLALWLQDRRRLRNLAKCDAMGRPLVSVIVPAHNAAATLEAAIESLLVQSYDRLEVLVVDDASTDETGALARTLSERDARLRPLNAPRQMGAALARNLGLAAARGAYLTFQDADDRSAPDRIERQLAALLGSDRYIASLCSYCRVDAEGRPLTINDRLYRKRTTSLLFPRDPVLQRLGGMAPLLRGEDSEYLGRFVAAFGRSAECFLYSPLYFAQFSESSLLWSEARVERTGNRINYDAAETTPRELERYHAWHRRIAAGEDSPTLPLEPAGQRDDPRASGSS